MVVLVALLWRRVSVGSEGLGCTTEFTAVLATRGLAVDGDAVASTAGGGAEAAEALGTWLQSR